MIYNDYSKNLPSTQGNFKMLNTPAYGWQMLDITPIEYNTMDELVRKISNRVMEDYKNAHPTFQIQIINALVHYHEVSTTSIRSI